MFTTVVCSTNIVNVFINYALVFPLDAPPSCLVTDYKTGFGGKFGVQKDRQDKSALGWDHIEKKQKHESQKGLL